MTFLPAKSLLFADFPNPDAVFRKLQPTVCQFREGEVLASAGNLADRLWLIQEGTVRIRATAADRSQVLVTRTVNEIVGEQGIIELNGRRTATMEAAEFVRALAVTAAQIDGLPPEERFILWRNLARIVSAKLAQATTRRAHLLAANEDTRLMMARLANPHGLSHLSADGSLSDIATDVTVITWFSDLVGFSKIAANVSADDAAALIRSVNSIQADLIGAGGGHLDKFMGDGVMAYWVVAPSDVATAAQRALNAARRSLADVRALCSPSPDHPIDLRIGLHLGEAKCGNFGSRDRWAWTIIGDAVNLGARYEQARESVEGLTFGPIRISPEFAANLSPDSISSWPTSTAEEKGRRFPILSGE